MEHSNRRSDVLWCHRIKIAFLLFFSQFVHLPDAGFVVDQVATAQLANGYRLGRLLGLLNFATNKWQTPIGSAIALLLSRLVMDLA